MLARVTKTLVKQVARPYHANVIDHFEKPRNVGSLDTKAKNVGTGMVGAPSCGDVMRLQIEVDDDGKIIDAKFKTFGCGSAIASSSLATEWLKGKDLESAAKIRNKDIGFGRNYFCNQRCVGMFIRNMGTGFQYFWLFR